MPPPYQHHNHYHHHQASLFSFSWLGWLSWTFQHISLAGLPTRLLCLSGISLGNVCVGACLYRLASGQPWARALFKVYGVLFRAPGIGVMQEETVLASLVLNTIFIFGLFVFATFLSMISDEVKQQLHAIRTGEVKLPLHNHIVVLNWNQQSISLLKQLSNAQSDPRCRLYKRPVVVLAEPSKAIMDARVAAAFKGSKLHVFCRSGKPARPGDLERVAAEAADTVIILQPDSSSQAAAEALKATALVSLTCLREQTRSQISARPSSTSSSAGMWRAMASRLRGRLSSQDAVDGNMRIVVQVLHPSNSQPDDVINFLQTSTATSMYSSKIQQVQLLSQNTLDRLVCQTAAEPGVATVFRELVRASADVRMDWLMVNDRLAGSYGHAASLLQDTVLLGVLAAEGGQLALNPPDHVMLSPGDRLVALTRQGCLSSALSAPRPSPWPRRQLRTVSRVSSMASPQLTDIKRSSSGGGVGNNSSSRSHSSLDGNKGGVQQSRSRAPSFIVLGWQEAAVPDLVLQLRGLVPRSSSITVVLPTAASGHPSGDKGQQHGSGVNRAAASVTCKQQQLQQQLPNDSGIAHNATAGQQAVSIVRAQAPGSMQALLDAGILEANAVILGPSLCSPSASTTIEGDSLVTTGLLAIQQALQTCGRHGAGAPTAAGSGEQHAADGTDAGAHARGPQSKLHVVAVCCSYSVRRALQTFLSSILLQCSFSYEIMVLDEFAAGMLVLVAQDLANALVIDQLLVQPSNGLSMWSLAKLGLDAEAAVITFQTVCNAARKHKCTALGYRREDGGMVLVPSLNTTLNVGDRVVVVDGSRGRVR